jgi:hypothetical protein
MYWYHIDWSNNVEGKLGVIMRKSEPLMEELSHQASITYYTHIFFNFFFFGGSSHKFNVPGKKNGNQ